MSLVHYFDKCFALDSTCCEGSLIKLLVAFSFKLTAKMLLPTRQAGDKIPSIYLILNFAHDMGFKKQKTVRLYSDGKVHHQEDPWEDTDTPQLEKSFPSFHVQSSLLRPERSGRLFGAPKIGNCLFPEDHEPWRKMILDPNSGLILQWNRVFFISCLVALFIDPLHFFLPSVWILGDGSLCMGTDLNLRIVVTILRTIVDMFYLLHMVIKFRTAYVAPSSRIFGRGELVMDPKMIAKRYLRSDFFIDLAAMLPLPQIVVWFIIPAFGKSHPIVALTIMLQFSARFCLISPLSSQIVKASGVVTMTAWAGAAYNLLLYTLASNVSNISLSIIIIFSYLIDSKRTW
ncbi:putative cyclic nucleotide-gated ion channel 14 isoform X1 [Cinnamomum micranthum f. kanehirae]|uniref:Putative cyclic nucleotide-gated ion channel 14 isoform X1 n=1 Tax=Cinnamomum micranthum f. kanehirae TaxID=337451 RepID=A0A3S3P1U4_9MAGN|nr:putative cyclic nucleotide-gated ion channel 14 isoform X1 [Cinnamomum micranthum f. kanehirae]